MSAEHERARWLILEGNASGPDAEWLESHISGCPGCRLYAEGTQRAVTALRRVSEIPSPTLVRATQRSVREVARNLADRESNRRMIILSSLFAAAWGVAFQPLLWRLSAWLADYLSVPAPMWQTAFVTVWLVPGMIALLLITQLPAVSSRFYKGRSR
jgi:Putative zinc-finger